MVEYGQIHRAMEKGLKTKKIIGILVLVIALMFVFNKGWITPIKSLSLRLVSTPVSKVVYVVKGVGETFVSFLRIGSLSRSVRILENKNAQLEARVVELNKVKEENDLLREQIKLLPRTKYNLLMSDVIGHTTDSVGEVLIINRGSNDGIKEGMPVIMNEGVVVGKISNVEKYSSQVMLITDTSFRLAASVQGSGAQGLVKGEKGIDVSLEEVPRNQEIKIGNKVATTGVDGLFPSGLFVGTIRSVNAPGNEIFQSAKITLPVDIRKARVVGIILNK